ncbi:choice-of-anchor D domain-containing protein [Accumulibacter sp.]|uniref:choice-of-anchor D domain-containing protein n=1 Tax=Accumulibacter sp. TaxID=2053492 RepID=UPI002CD327E2|nr:choice-of-anchor D domain-containing protein [Accumulibacter sp.]HRF06552.1 choice-of-anchor D domain-containing protein [Accumulibacter sp.]
MRTSYPMHRKLIHIAVLGAMAAIATPASALDFVWNGGTGNWSPAGSWSQAGLPGSADNVFIDNGNLTNSVVSLNVGATINDLSISSGDSLGMNTATSLTILGNVSNAGSFGLNSAPHVTDLLIGDTTTFSGSGTLTMSNSANNRIYGRSGSGTEVLTNASAHSIQGAGQLGLNRTGLNNQGLIVADQANALTIDLSGGVGVTRTNTGILRAAGGQLTIQGSDLINTGGVIDAVGTNVVITGSTVTGGTLQSSSGGKVFVQGSSNLSSVSNTGQVEIATAQTGLLTGTFTNTGNLQLASANHVTDLTLNGDVTLTGAGTLTMSNSTNNRIYGNSGSGSEVLTNASGHTIQGAGQLGVNRTGLDNQGVILAEGSAGLLIDVSAAGMSNSGILRAGTGVLTIQNSTVTSTPSGLLDAAGSDIVITGSTINGTVQGSGSNKIFVQGFSNLVDVTNSTQLEIATAQTGLLTGTFTNTGNLQLASANHVTDLTLNGDVTLTGAGTLTMSNSTNNRIYGNSGSGSEVLTNASGHTIQGAGQLGVNRTGLDNQGVILAEGSAGLLIDVSAAGMSNSGILRAGTGVLTIQNSTVTSTPSGLLDAAGSDIVITGSTINGTVQGSGSNKIFVQGFSNLVDVTNSTQLEIATAQTGLLTGTFTNTGNLQLASANHVTDLTLNGDVTLTGAGTLTMSNSTNNRIYGNSGSGSEVLTNASGHTIQGAGQLGVNRTGLDNQGLIVANQSNELTIDLSGGAGITRSNTGILRAAGGQLTIQGTNLTNTGGVIDAVGSNVLITGSTITNGTLQSSSDGKIFVQASSNLNNVNNTGQVELATAQTALLTGTFTNTGNLQLASANHVTDLTLNGDVTLTGAGTLTMSNSTNNRIYGNSGSGSEVLTNASGHTIQGAGQLGLNRTGLNNQGLILANQSNALTIDTSAAGLINDGTLRAQNGTLTINDALGGSGSLQVDPASVMNLANVANTQGRLLMGAAGSMLNIGTQNLTINADYTNTAAGAGNAFDRRAGVSGAGLILAGGDVAQVITGTTVTNGDTANATLTIGNVRVGANDVAYQIANTGSTGPALRGAVQTSVNGANLSDARLTGAGVSAGNYNTGGPGSNTGDQVVTFTAAAAGALAPLTGQVLNLRSNFENIPDQKLNIVLGSGAAAYNAAAGNATPSPIQIANQRVGGTPVTQLFTVSNNAAAGAFSEDLNASFAGSSGDAAISGGNILGLIAGGSNATAMGAQVDNSTAGAKTGTVTLNYQTAGTVNGVSNGLGTASAGSQVLTVNGNVYQVAAGAVQTAALNFGTIQVGQSVSQNLVIRNTASGAAGFVEDLNADFGATSGTGASRITGTGSLNGILAGTNSNAGNGVMTVSVNTLSAGVVAGDIAVNYTSAGAVGGVSNGLGTTPAGSEAYGVSGTIQTVANVINQASPLVNNPLINLGAKRVGDSAASANVSVTNQATLSPQAALNASIAPAGGPVSASGSFDLLDPGATDSSSLVVGLNTATAGNFTGGNAGSATISFVSDANNVGGCAPNCQMTLASQNVSIEGKVYTQAVRQLDTTSVDFGIVRVGDSVSAQNIAVSNTAAVTALNDTLRANLSGVSGPFSGSNTVGGVNAQSSGSIGVGLNTSTAGIFTQNGTVSFLSQNADMSDASAGANGGVQVRAQVNNLANGYFSLFAGLGTMTQSGDTFTLNLGNIAMNSTNELKLKLSNNVGGPADDLSRGLFDLTAADDFTLTGWGPISSLGAGQMSDDLDLSYLATEVGLFRDTIDFSGFSTNAHDPSGIAQKRQLIILANVVDHNGTVPEPGTLLLLAMSLAGMLLQRRREMLD